MFVFAGSGAFTGSTTTSWMTITPSGLTSGTGVYLPLAAITTGMGLNIAGSTTLTSGSLVSISSSATAATCTDCVCNVTYTRSAGGDAIDGIKLILSDGTTSFEEDIEGDVGSLETKTAAGIDTNITAPTSVEVAVYFEDASGTKQLCTQTNVFNFA